MLGMPIWIDYGNGVSPQAGFDHFVLAKLYSMQEQLQTANQIYYLCYPSPFFQLLVKAQPTPTVPTSSDNTTSLQPDTPSLT
jgi:hypothetical protein